MSKLIFFEIFSKIFLKKTSLLDDALKEIKEWWQVFEDDKDYCFTDDVYAEEIINYLKEDGFPEDIIKKAMYIYSTQH